MTCKHFLFAIVFAFPMLAAAAMAGESGSLVSSNEMIFDARADHEGISISVAADVPATRYTEDYAPSQVLELIRPGGGPIAVGRLVTSCSCLSATMEKREFGPGERALIEVRTVKKPPIADAVYAVIVQLASPHRTALQFDFAIPKP